MKKMLLVVLLALSVGIVFAEDLKEKVYGENSITVTTYTDQNAILLEIILPADNIVFRYWTKGRYETHILDEFDIWDTRISLGLNTSREIIAKYNAFSDAAFEFGSDISQYISRAHEGTFTVYSFEMYKSASYEVFMATYNLF